MSIEGNIIVAERKNVLVVPRVFVFEKEYVKNKDKEKIKFRKGIEDLEYVEVLQGIDDKTEIIDAIE
jgi:predicted transcriptional regulator